MKGYQLCHVEYVESSTSQWCVKCGEHLIPASIAFSHTFFLTHCQWSLTVMVDMLYFWFLLCWWFSYTWNKICCISGSSHLISDHVYDSVSTCLYIIDRKYLHGFSARQILAEHCNPVMFGSWVRRYWLILQSKQLLQGVTWQNRCANSLSYSLTVINEGLPCSVNAVI